MTAGGSPNLANRWEHFAHGADIGIRGYGNTIEEAFEQAALALTAVVCDPSEVHASEWVTIACDAPEGDLLLTDWLNALIYEMATRKMLFTRFDVHIIGTRLEGKACGEAVVRERHRPTVEPKGATYTALRVGQDEDGAWVAQCVVDV
jgi:tRNA nucleotidyltransferase (CCA-adding enzyme)